MLKPNQPGQHLKRKTLLQPVLIPPKPRVIRFQQLFPVDYDGKKHLDSTAADADPVMVRSRQEERGNDSACRTIESSHSSFLSKGQENWQNQSQIPHRRDAGSPKSIEPVIARGLLSTRGRKRRLYGGHAELRNRGSAKDVDPIDDILLTMDIGECAALLNVKNPAEMTDLMNDGCEDDVLNLESDTMPLDWNEDISTTTRKAMDTSTISPTTKVWLKTPTHSPAEDQLDRFSEDSMTYGHEYSPTLLPIQLPPEGIPSIGLLPISNTDHIEKDLGLCASKDIIELLENDFLQTGSSDTARFLEVRNDETTVCYPDICDATHLMSIDDEDRGDELPDFVPRLGSVDHSISSEDDCYPDLQLIME